MQVNLHAGLNGVRLDVSASPLHPEKHPGCEIFELRADECRVVLFTSEDGLRAIARAIDVRLLEMDIDRGAHMTIEQQLESAG